MSTHQTTVPAAEGKANAGAVHTGAGATPWMPDREAGARPFAPGNDDGEILGGTPRYPSSSPLGPASTQTPASPTVPLGEAGPHSSDADAVGAPASEGPRWAPVDDDTADLLSILSLDGSPIGLDEWPYFLSVLEKVATENAGLIDQNLTRPMLRGQIRPARTGSFFHRAARMGLIRADGWNESDDREQRNGGKPIRVWRWIGTTTDLGT